MGQKDVAIALAAMMAATQDPQFTSMNLNKGVRESEPDWKRKKCKSCRSISYCHGAYQYPNKQACKEYQKKKK